MSTLDTIDTDATHLLVLSAYAEACGELDWDKMGGCFLVQMPASAFEVMWM